MNSPGHQFQPLSISTAPVSFKYDPFGRRIYKSSSSGTSVFAYDGDNLIEEANSSGTAVARYSQGLNIDEPLAMLRSSTTSYYQADGLGSITSLSSGAGSLTQTYTFDSFGKQTASSGSLTNPFQYTARESDPETGLYYYRARYYDQGTGRFLSEDEIGNDEGLDLYLYARNDPVQFRDPTGFYRLVGFSQNDEQQMRNAIQSAINTLKVGGCKGCAGGDGPKIIHKLQSATYVYDENYMEDGLAVCGSARPLNSKKITITHRAFMTMRCCSLPSTLAHEAMHKALQSDDEQLMRNMEDKCFGCAR